MSAHVKIEFAGHCDIRSAPQRRTDLIEALREVDEVRIVSERVESVDLTFVQLFISASKTAAASHRRLRFESMSDAVIEAFARAGVKLSATRDKIVLP